MDNEIDNMLDSSDSNFDSLIQTLEYEDSDLNQIEENDIPLFSAGLFNTDQSIEQITAAFQHIDEEGFVDATKVLIKLGVDPIPLLLNAVETVDEEETFQNIARALSVVGESAVPLLLDKLRNDSSFTMQATVASALGYIKDKRAIEPLKDALSKQKWWINYQAIWALGELKAIKSIK